MIETYIVDSFAEEPFCGNPAAVCLLDKRQLEVDQMLAIAQELRLSETAFVHEVRGSRIIRYFSPRQEIPLCGHATLAAAKTYFHKYPEDKSVSFTTLQPEILKVDRSGDLLGMRLPSNSLQAYDPPSAMMSALGIDSMIAAGYNPNLKIISIHIPDVFMLRNLKPDFHKLITSEKAVNGIVVSADSDDYDFEYRYFWPWSGTEEDPATGGVHTFLAGYWRDRLDKDVLHAFQCSERGGHMKIQVTENYEIIIWAKAVLVLSGHLHL